MADVAVIEEGPGPAETPLVVLTFQRNDNRKQKYLEAEPKALGMTQIGLSTFQIVSMSVFMGKELTEGETSIPFFISSLLVVIAGCVAVAAQNLHVPTLRACLGMQIVACIACSFNVVFTMITMSVQSFGCYHYHLDNVTGPACRNAALQSVKMFFSCIRVSYVLVMYIRKDAQSHYYAEGEVIHATLLAISVTLAIYCCKVINCCAPHPKMPVITVQAPPVQEQ